MRIKKNHHYLGPFITAAATRRRKSLQTSRRCRKGLAELAFNPKIDLADQIYQHALLDASRLHILPRQPTRAQWLGYSIASAFALGAFLFIFASVVHLWVVQHSFKGYSANAIYACGSIFFTTAGYLQLLEAINGDIAKNTGKSFKYWGFSPRNLGYLSCLSQFFGTVMFNFNTFFALLPNLTISESNLFIWVPNMVGSLLFMVASYFAWIEQHHAFWVFNRRSWSSWIVLINGLGSVFFLMSAFTAFFPDPALPVWIISFSTLCTFFGGIFFFVAALMLVPEYAVE